MRVKRVWFVSHYSMPPEYEMRIKTQMFAHFLGLQGIDCTIFSASTIHNTNINLIQGKEEYIERQYGDLRFVHIRCSSYTKTDLKRIVNMEQFAYRFKKVAENYTLPDIIIADTYCISYKPIFKFCRKHGIPFVVDVRDLWPQSIIEYLHFSEKNPIIQLMYNMERNMYSAADRIIFSFDGGYDYIRDRNLEKTIPKEKVFFINNGVDLDAFIHDSKEYRIQDEDLNSIEFFKVVYVGSIRKVNNLGILLDAAKEVKDKSIRFLIWGAGDELDDLQTRVKEEGIDNVVFKGYIEKKYIPYITQKADLNLIHNNPSDIFRYGISFNKIFDYMASGKPSLTTFPCQYNPAVYEGAGVEVINPVPSEIANTIEQLSKGDLSCYAQKAREAAKKYDYQVLAKSLLDILSEI